MLKNYNLEPVKQALATAKQTLILLAQNPDHDSAAAGLALYLSLSKQQLNVSVGCATPMTVGFNRLFGVDKIKPRIGNQNLVISFNYPEDSLEKVSYDKDPANQKFNITIEPKAGLQVLDVNSVEYSYTGSNADVIFVIGARGLEDLGDLFKSEQKLLEDKSKILINLSSLDKNSQFGTVNLYDPTASGCSEIMFAVLTGLQLPVDADMATNLLVGIELKTANFTSTQTSADTFEIVSQLMRLGAKKGHLPTPAPPRPFMVNPAAPAWPRPTTPTSIPFSTPISAAPAAPSDWLKPKVITSSSQPE
ncbi:MAG: Exopolyphosphatase family protein [Candidatus Beckwithbacteria bacterium GW2011_GWA2_43_10]|uniref:Exopolyphosphatase family protein n=1 Tax=Candidatus Beckwithbacteria bacterium GW2011_GWA2_43_10 TaxID=1618369 RepID=A0A0G1C3A2_9BACT|nr:MAG: Exopolyphosphatase family protein [Candidatus Beckwithbacteria bacterium GW2011_GWA2_43_10]